MSQNLKQRKAEAEALFANCDEFYRSLKRKKRGTVVLRTNDGLKITIRQNIWDARIVREIFFERPYTRHLSLPPDPVIVDIGGYIGDFSLYAAKYLNAERIIVYEPTAENFRLLRQNIEDNDYSHRITAVNKAVSSSNEVVLNVQIDSGEEVHVSAYWYNGAEQRRIPSVTLGELMATHHLDSIDLLKVDCEGGEYDIFSSVPEELFHRIGNIVFEYHHIDGFEAKLDRVLSRLKSVGYTILKDDEIISASRVHNATRRPNGA